ncbi:MAG TPA: amphi-Trp domain-containing protein [Asanoa sp.]|jgi:amphi-Trp domain-containing protein
MAEVEFTKTIRLSREQAGERLIVLGKALTAGSTSELDDDGESIRFAVANELDWEFELEVDGDEVELEIELKWSNGTRAAPAVPAAVPARSSSASRRTTSPRRGGRR